MGRKKESSDEYEPDVVDDDEVEENEASEEEEVPLPEMLTERRAKINRREIVESEDSDRKRSKLFFQKKNDIDNEKNLQMTLFDIEN